MRETHHHTVIVGGIIAVAAVAVNAVVAYAFWRVDDVTAAAVQRPDVAVELAGSGLAGGDTADLAVTVANPHSFAVRVSAVAPAGVARHRGCEPPALRPLYGVSWRLGAGATRTFVLDGVAGDGGCVWEVPVLVTGMRE